MKIKNLIISFLATSAAVSLFLLKRRKKDSKDRFEAAGKEKESSGINLPEAFKRIKCMIKEMGRDGKMSVSSIIRKDDEGNEIGCVIVETRNDPKKRKEILNFQIGYHKCVIRVTNENEAVGLYAMREEKYVEMAFQEAEKILRGYIN